MPLTKPSHSGSSTTIVTTSSGETRSASEPATKNVGDSWLELNSLDFPVYGWLWRWDGGKWLSPDFYWNYSLLGVSARFDSLIACNPSFNYFFKSISSNSLHGNQQDASTYWEYWLILLKSSNGFAPIFTENTIGHPPNIWNAKTTPIGILINSASSEVNLFDLIVQPKGYSTPVYAAIQLTYNLSRL